MMSRLRALLLIAAIAASLSGCAGAFRIGQQPKLGPGVQIVERNGEEEIEAIQQAPQPLCQARARFFKGTVQIPCEEIARTVAP